MGCGILDALAAAGAPESVGVHPGGGAPCRSCSRPPKWASCSRCWRSRGRTDRLAGLPLVDRRHRSVNDRYTDHDGVAHGNADRHRQPRHGIAAGAACPLSSASHGRRHRRRAARTSTRSGSTGANSTPTSTAARTRSPRSASRAATASPRCSPTRSSSSPPTGRARSSAPPSCRCRRSSPRPASRRCSPTRGRASSSASSDSVAMLDEVRAGRRAARAPAWVLIDAAADDEARRLSRVRTAASREASDARAGVAVEAGDLLTLMYTSGTTGMPKGIQHTHFIRAMYATTMANAWRMAPESVVLHSGALVFNGAMTTMFPAFMLGRDVRRRIAHSTPRRSSPPSSASASRTRCSCRRRSSRSSTRKGFDPARLASLEMVLSLGAPLHQEHKDRLNALLPRRFYELYGLTEGFVTVLDRDDARAQGRQRRRAAAVLRVAHRRRRRPRSAGGRDRRDRRTRPDHDARLLQPPGRDGAARCATAGSTRAISATSTTTASSTSSTARRT